jgi:hypothetical protein
MKKALLIPMLLVSISSCAFAKDKPAPEPTSTKPELAPEQYQELRAIHAELQLLQVQANPLIVEQQKVVSTFNSDHPGWTIAIDQAGNPIVMPKQTEPEKPTSSPAKH